jgi:acetyl-CoA carboxylase biotin carboxyl carrier protein
LAKEFSLTPEDVSDIVAIISTSGFDQLDVSTTRFRLILSRKNEGWTQEWTWNEVSEVEGAGTPTATKLSSAPTRDLDAATAPVEYGGLAPVTAPLPGTFYRSPQPGAPPYVTEGDAVEEGTILGIIETMKLMSPVTAAGRGTIVQILVSNGMPIDAETTLMLIRPDPS